MVKVRDDVARDVHGRIEVEGWVSDLVSRHGDLDAATVTRACELVRSLGGRGEIFLERGMELAELVSDLRLDTSAVVAALAYRSMRVGLLTPDQARDSLGAESAHLLEEVLRMASTSLLEMNNTRLQTSEHRDQAENVRRMLIAMIDDARVAVLKLAERVVALRAAKHDEEDRKQRIAREAHLVFAPLANRLGIWQLKWELEDLALRYLAPDIYVTIARQLDGRREEREARIAGIAAELQHELRARGIEANVIGRAKHIYSIWRKMRAKNVPFDQVYDVRAVRVLVPDIAQCYAALGVIHTQWRHVPSEFDDYIAVPKENGYRSIHTAVVGPGGRTLEVQIRTAEMHEEAELGVCAHWSYKDGEAEDRPYSEKMNWLRQVVEWRDDVERNADRSFGEELRQVFRDERIFVSTPQGHVLDLTDGATPVDFAYRVHTEVGHRCRGALVEGRPSALNMPLETGQRVEIITADEPAPRREWLEDHLGFVRSGRAREKIHDWFRARGPEVNEREGRDGFLDLMARLDLPRPSELQLQAVAGTLGFDHVPGLWQALGAGDCQGLEVLEALHPTQDAGRQLALLPGMESPGSDECQVSVRAQDRQGLLRDVTGLLGELGVSLTNNSGRSDPRQGTALLSLDVRCHDLRHQAILVGRLAHLPGVQDVRITRP